MCRLAEGDAKLAFDLVMLRMSAVVRPLPRARTPKLQNCSTDQEITPLLVESKRPFWSWLGKDESVVTPVTESVLPETVPAVTFPIRAPKIPVSICVRTAASRA
jgi:hypothetical protein